MRIDAEGAGQLHPQVPFQWLHAAVNGSFSRITEFAHRRLRSSGEIVIFVESRHAIHRLP
jgi:hypothetical protein